MVQQNLNVGTAPGDDTGDGLRTAMVKVQANFDEVYGGALPVASHTHDLSDISDSGTAAALDVPATGDAAAGEVVKGDDTRLTDARTPTAHTQAASTITDFSTAADARIAAASIGALADVDISGVTDGQLLAWNNTSGQIEPVNPVEGGGDVASVNGSTGVVVLDADDIDDAATTNKFTTQAANAKLASLSISSPAEFESLIYDGSNFTNQLSANYKSVFNNTGGTIGEGTLVNVTGSGGGLPLITVADKDTDDAVSGITVQDIGADTTGVILLTGTLQEAFINTLSLTAGSPLYLGSSGAFTDVKPTTGNIIQIGKVGVVAAASGSILLDCPASVLDTDAVKNTGAVISDPTGITGADQITNMVSLTQSEYDAIGTPDASTFYVIVG